MNILPAQLIPYLKEELDRLHQEKATGEMTLTHRRISVTIFLLAGRLQYVTDGEHRVRRWKRAIAKYCHDWIPPTQIVNSQPWEYDLLYQSISKKKLTLDQAKSVIKAVAEECLSELALATQMTVQWVTHDRIKSTFSYFLSLSLEEIHPALTEIAELRQEWHNQGLDKLLPNLAPTLTEKGKTIHNPTQQLYLNGEFTIWDIALKLKQPIAKVTKSLLPWQQKELIEFKTIPDLPAPVEDVVEESKPSKPVTTSPSTANNNINPLSNKPASLGKSQFLIACIDDSPIVIHNLKSILAPAGFQVLSIQEPMAGFAQLIEHKPDLILLDLNMPNANGYSICKFLRETPVFVKTPIIILTAQDSSIDRTRAKLVGANDFISKPPEAKALVNLIRSYLPQTKEALNQLAVG